MVNKGKYEYVLCAAIDYKGVIICGHRHGDCYITLKHLCNISDAKNINKVGFLTSKNIFVSREEAGKIAFEAGQIKKFTDCLISEDLY